MLLGRRAERARIDTLLDEARRGRAGGLLLRGEPGIGKSVLLGYAIEQAAHMTVLPAQGVESQAELPYAGLAELLAPVLALLDEIPAPQGRALGGVLALTSAEASDRFAIFAGVLSVISAAAERCPVLLVVDDVHWLDTASLDAIRFVVRRVRAERLALLFAMRDGSGAPDLGPLPELELGGLGRADVSALMTAVDRRHPSDAVVAQLIAASGGNPLALLELADQLSDSQLKGDEPIEEPMPIGQALLDTYRRRLAQLPAVTRQALVVAATSESGEVAEIGRALRSLELPMESLDEAEEAHVLAFVAGRVRWRHPLLRSAAYHGVRPSERRRSHRAIASAIERREPDRAAWHHSAAVVEPSERVAQKLECAGQRSSARHSHVAAERALRRAAELSPAVEARARRLLAAAEAAWAAGRMDPARTLSGEALASDASLAAAVSALRGRIESACGSPMAAHDLLVAEASRSMGTADGATSLLVDATVAAITAGELHQASETGRRALATSPGAGSREHALASMALGIAEVLRGERQIGRRLVNSGRALLAEALGIESQLHRLAVAALFWLEEYDTAHDLLTTLVDEARSRSLLSILPGLLDTLAAVEYRAGRWSLAHVHSAEAARLAEDTEQQLQLASCLTTLGRLEAARGDERARGHLLRAMELAETYGTALIGLWARAGLGLLELSLGSAETAVDLLERVAHDAERTGLGDPAALPFAPDLVEAHVRAGDTSRARRAVARLEARAAEVNSAWASGVAMRCHALLSDDFDGGFSRALTWHEGARMPFELARTQLVYGERLRRARRRRESRLQLRSALGTFEQLGAEPWANRARSELSATGETRQARVQGNQQLTPQELQVALLIAEGASNREAAERLFLSPRTVDFHLGNIYRKMGIRSRTQLVRCLLAAGG